MLGLPPPLPPSVGVASESAESGVPCLFFTVEASSELARGQDPLASLQAVPDATSGAENEFEKPPDPRPPCAVTLTSNYAVLALT